MDHLTPRGRGRSASSRRIASAVGTVALALVTSGETASAARQARAPVARAAVPLPPPRPDGPPEPVPAPAASTIVAPTAQAGVDPALCLDRLAKLGVKVEARPPISEGACRARHPFRVTDLPDGVAATPAADVTCPMVEAIARWVDEVVEPEAKSHLGHAPKTILIGTSYQCRGQNRVGGAKLSEHAYANAIDVMGFTFDKGPALSVAARGPDTPEGRFQAAVRVRACAYFTTVLGPGTDLTHADHLHLDLRERKGGYRICQ